MHTLDDEAVEVAFVSPISDKTWVVMLERKYLDRSATQTVEIIQYEARYIVRDKPGKAFTGNERMREFAEAYNRDKKIGLAERAVEKFQAKWNRLTVVKKGQKKLVKIKGIKKELEQQQGREKQRRAYDNLLKQERGRSL